MATSGLLMFVIEKPSFVIQMEPVHKLFGLVMVAAAIGHIYFNHRSLLNHLKTRGVLLLACILTGALVILYGVAINNPVPAALASRMDSAAAEAEAGER